MTLILDRYIARTVLGATVMVVIVFSALLFLMLFIGEVDDMGRGSYNLWKILAFSFLKLPARIHFVFPAVALLGSLFALGGLAADSELIIIRSAGVSMRRLAVSVGLAGLALALFSVAMGEYIVPQGIQKAESMRDEAMHGDSHSSSDSGLWMRNNGYILRIHTVLPGGRIQGLTVYRIDDHKHLSFALEAEQARVDGKQLLVDRPRITRLKGLDIKTDHSRHISLPVTIKPEVLRLAVTQPGELSSAGLWAYIRYLDEHDIDSADYKLAFWRNIMTPFTIWVLTLFALPFAFGSLRSASAGQRLFMGGLAGLLFFLVNEITASAGPVYGLPPWFAASLPTVLLALGGLYWMRRLD